MLNNQKPLSIHSNCQNPDNLNFDISSQHLLKPLAYIGVISILSLLFLFSFANKISAASCAPPNSSYTCLDGCNKVGDCVSTAQGGQKCVVSSLSPPIVSATGPQCNLDGGSVVIGRVIPPEGVSLYNALIPSSAGNKRIGILLFISNALKFFAVICGLLVFFNILYAGYEYIVGAGKTDVHVKVRERLTWSVVGLILLIAAYMIAALIGLFIFGDPAFLLNPDLTKYGALAPP